MRHDSTIFGVPRYIIFFISLLLICIISYLVGKQTGIAEFEAGGCIGGGLVAIIFLLYFVYDRFFKEEKPKPVWKSPPIQDKTIKRQEIRGSRR
jgi:energy-coupling factor transporter transmembrane protein EcfT